MLKKILKIGVSIFFLWFLVNYIIVIMNFKLVSENTKQYILNNFSYEEIQYFTTIGFGHEFNSNGDYSQRFLQEEITFKIIGHPSNDDRRFLFKTVDTLNNTMLYNQIKFINDTTASTAITVYFWTEEEWKKNMPDRYSPTAAGCIIPRIYKQNVLTKMDVIILTDVSFPTKQKSTIIQEITQVLGLFQDSENEKRTIFSDYLQDTCFGPMDLACVKILYNSGLQPGVRQDTFEEALGISDEKTLERQKKPIKKSLFELN
ncbi:MAG: DUF2927 domain-containing protein [Bacteroidetes bacterium]|nr:DUF2927 domain-containing protein [Bacteroidota bacterium]